MPTFAETPSSQVWWRAVRVVFAIALVGIVAVALWDRPREYGTDVPVNVTLYGASYLEDVLELDALPEFAMSWRESTGERIEFVASFAGSGLITDRVVRRFPAEMVVLASELDADRLVEHAILPGTVWRNLPGRGVPFHTPMALLVREGGPGTISRWDDLTRPDVGIVLPDPTTSGCGELAVLAIWGEAIRSGAPHDEAIRRLERVADRIVAMPPSARAARLLFEQGVGDVAVLYEAEALVARGGSTVVPDATLVAEPIVCVIPARTTMETRERIDALADYLSRDVDPTVWAGHRFRLRPERASEPPGWFTLADLGTARELRRDVLGAIWRDRIRRVRP